MALIQCASCGRYMGVGVSRCIYCAKPIDDTCTIIQDRPNVTRPEPEQKGKIHAYAAVLWVSGLLLAGIGAVLSAMLPVIGIPTVFAGGFILLKASRQQNK